MNKRFGLIVAVLMLLAVPLYAATIFSDDFDGEGDTGWDCSDGVRTGYTDGSNCPASSSYGGVTHYAGEISTGGRSGNSFKMWRRNGLWAGTDSYYGYLNRDLTSGEFNNHYKEIYVRWYVKIPPQWEVNSYLKLNRLHFGSSAGSHDNEWYINIEDPLEDTFRGAPIRMYIGSTSESYYSAKTVAQMGLNDGQWHCLEYRFKLNSTTGSSDGGFNVWVDEESLVFEDFYGNTVNTAALNIGAATNEYFTSILPPAIGNLSGTWQFDTNGWYAIEFDDYAVATEYIGPVGGSSPSTPTIRSGSVRSGGFR